MASVTETLKSRVLEGGKIGDKEAMTLYEEGMKKPFYLIAAASEIREHFKGKKINLCGIVNAKSGRCAENCKFCAQSAHYKTSAPSYPLLSAEEIVCQAKVAKENGAHMFGIVTSGTKISSEKEWEEIVRAVKGIKELGILPCASLGIIDRDKAKELKKSGLFRYHHNLETSRSFFPNICTTHSYEEDVNTIVAAK